MSAWGSNTADLFFTVDSGSRLLRRLGRNDGVGKFTLYARLNRAWVARGETHLIAKYYFGAIVPAYITKSRGV